MNRQAFPYCGMIIKINKLFRRFSKYGYEYSGNMDQQFLFLL